jgi:hypothetical protein
MCVSVSCLNGFQNILLFFAFSNCLRVRDDSERDELSMFYIRKEGESNSIIIQTSITSIIAGGLVTLSTFFCRVLSHLMGIYTTEWRAY